VVRAAHARLPALGLARDLGRTPGGPAQNLLLFRTVMLEVLFGSALGGPVLHRVLQ